MNQGLAGQGQPVMDGSGQGQGQGRQMIDEVKAMLMQGATPQELLAQGVPEEVIMMAIQELEQELAAQQPAQPQGMAVTEPGLAAQGRV